MTISRFIHVGSNVTISFSYTAEYYFTIYLCYHIFSIHSFVEGHLGCFCVLVIVNSAAVNFGHMHLFELWFYPDRCPGEGLLHRMATLVLVF